MVKKNTSSHFVEKALKIKFVKHILLPSCLVIITAAFAGFTALTTDARFTVLPSNHYSNVTIEPKETKLYQGKKIQGSFTAKENYLGSVALRLKNYNEGNKKDGRKIVKEDKIIFRIKEQGKKQWYYENQYNGGQFHELDYFPFGFEAIPDSKEKSYYFEILSKDGNDTNVLTLTHGYPLLKTNYQFNKSLLLQDKNILLKFLLQKQVYALTIIDYYFALIVYILPLVLYLIWLSPYGGIIHRPTFYLYKKFIKIFDIPFFKVIARHMQKVTIYEVVVLFGIATDVLLIHQSYQLIFSLLLFLWIVRIILGKFKSDVSFIISVALILLCSIFFLFQNDAGAEKIAVWAFYFMLVGSIHALIELKVWKK